MFISSFLFPLVALGARVLAVPTVSNGTHDLSATYDLTRSGAGGHSIEPPNLFAHLDARVTPKISRDLAAVGPDREYHEPQFDATCLQYQVRYIVEALVFAREYITAAIDYVEERNDKAIYERWFGPYEYHRADNVVRSLMWMRARDIVRIRFSCACTDRHRSFRFENRPHFRRMHICTPFWNANRVGPWPSKALVLVRSGMATYGNPINNAVTVRDCEGLARDSPDDAIRNPPNNMEFIRTVSRLPRGVGTPFVL